MNLIAPGRERPRIIFAMRPFLLLFVIPSPHPPLRVPRRPFHSFLPSPPLSCFAPLRPFKQLEQASHT